MADFYIFSDGSEGQQRKRGRPREVVRLPIERYLAFEAFEKRRLADLTAPVSVRCDISDVHDGYREYKVRLKGTIHMSNVPDINLSDTFETDDLEADDIGFIAERKAFVEQKLRELAKAFADGEAS